MVSFIRSVISEFILRVVNRILPSKKVSTKLAVRLYNNSVDKYLYSRQILSGVSLETNEAKFIHSKMLFNEEKYFEAKNQLETLLDDYDFCRENEVLELIFRCCLKTGNFKQADITLHQILDEKPNSFHLLNYIYVPYRTALMRQELVAAFSRSKRSGLVWPYGTQHNFIRSQDISIKNGHPSILINCLPKSASTSISNLIQNKFDMPACNIGLSFFPDEVLIPTWLAAFKRGGAVCVQHVDASDENLATLERFGITRVVIHVRDPRQAILSWTYYLDTRFTDTKNHTLRSLNCPIIPPYYESWVFEEKVTWNIHNYFPLFVKWIKDWCDVDEDRNSKFQLKFTTFEDLRNNEDEFLYDLFDFCGLGLESKTTMRLDKIQQNNFRQGEVSEWRAIMTQKQIKFLKRYWDQKFNSKFGWENF